jgi:hypothetical protein
MSLQVGGVWRYQLLSRGYNFTQVIFSREYYAEILQEPRNTMVSCY